MITYTEFRVGLAGGADTIFRRAYFGAFWTSLSAGCAQGLTLVAAIIVGRFLGKQGFGEFGTIQSTTAVLGIFAGMGLGLTTTKHVAQYRIASPDRAGRIIGAAQLFSVVSGLALMLGGCASAAWLAAVPLGAAHLAGGLRLSSALILLNAINGVQNGTLLGLEAFRALAAVNILRSLGALPLVFLCTRRYGLTGALLALDLSAGVGCVLAFVIINRICRSEGIKISHKITPEEWTILWRFSTPALLSSALPAPAMWLASTTLARSHNGYSELGIYAAANQWRYAVLFLPGNLAQACLPVLAQIYAQGRKHEYTTFLYKSTGLSALLAAIPALLLALFSSRIMSLYGPAFTQGAPVLTKLALSAVLAAACSVLGQAIASTGRMWAGFFLNATWAATLLAIAMTAHEKSANMLASATIVSYVLHCAWSVVVSRVMTSGKNPPGITAGARSTADGEPEITHAIS